MSSAPSSTEPRYRGIPIRWRLALINAALTFIIVGAFAIAVGELTTSRIRSDFNHQLSAAADDLQSRIRVTAQPTFGGGFDLSLEAPDLNVYAGSQHAVIRILLPNGTAKQTRDAPNLGVASANGTYDIGGYRVAQRQILLPNISPTPTVIVQYARRISDIDATVARVHTFLVLGVIGGALLALLGGVLLARRAMRPIDRLTTTAREIARTRDPSQRIPQPRADDEIAELARTLDGMLQALESSRAETESALARQRQFVADASHELRTPLTSVLVNLELLVDVLEGDQGEAARSALRSSRRMRRLVQDLLLLARADGRRELPHAPVDVSQVLVEAVAELEPVAGAHHLSVGTAPGAWVVGSRDDLHRVVLNLMENAMRHTPPGTYVRAAVAAGDDDVVLTVEDDGPGIPPDLREKLFERFVRGAGDAGGSFGLGLSIVRAVATTHGGDVTVEDAHPGARFVVRLPRIDVPTGDDPADLRSGTSA